MNAALQGFANFLDKAGGPDPGLSDVGRRWEAERTLMRRDPMRAMLYRIEAIADQRVSGNQCAASSLAEIRDLIVREMSRVDGRAYTNPLFP